jgi:hypothetical protein
LAPQRVSGCYGYCEAAALVAAQVLFPQRFCGQAGFLAISLFVYGIWLFLHARPTLGGDFDSSLSYYLCGASTLGAFFVRWEGFFPPAFRRHYRSHYRRHCRSGCRSAFYLGMRTFCSRYHNSRTRLTASKHAMSFGFSFYYLSGIYVILFATAQNILL